MINRLGTPGKNKLLWNFQARANGRLHENRGVKSFSQLQDERKIPSSKQGLATQAQPNHQICQKIGKFGGLAMPSALARTMEFFAHLGVGWTILRPGFHGGVPLRERENFIIIYFYRECHVY